MTRVYKHITYTNGSFEEKEIPWTKHDYYAEIALLESQITNRRLREAVLTQDGADWLAAKEAEIQALRDESVNV